MEKQERFLRGAGILLPIFSLPSEFGIGALDDAAYRFVDFLERAGQKYWQILPINPTGYADSPYQSSCAFAGNPYFLDISKILPEEEVFVGGNPIGISINVGEGIVVSQSEFGKANIQSSNIFKEGDIITKIDNTSISNINDFEEILGKNKGDKVEIEFVRKGKVHTKTIEKVLDDSGECRKIWTFAVASASRKSWKRRKKILLCACFRVHQRGGQRKGKTFDYQKFL